MCIVVDCLRNPVSKGMCRRHYDRWRRYGTTTMAYRPRGPFEDKVRKTKDCWWWDGYVTAEGYGALTISGKRVAAHRHAWELAKGPITPGAFICHTCDNRLCVRPDHLYEGDHGTNMLDMVQRGRARSGTQRLTPTTVRLIRKLRAEGRTVTSLAEEYGIHWTHVSDICNRKRWRSVE